MAEIFGSTTTTPLNPDAFSGGGGDIIIDQVYDSTSENAQSGIAVAQAIVGVEETANIARGEAGQALEKAEEALATVGGETWEKITDTTLTEEAVVLITKDIDGNQIRLKKFKILVDLPAVTSATTLWLKQNNILTIATQASSATAQNPAYSISAEYTFNWQYLVCTNNSNEYSNGAIYSTPYGNRYNGAEKISFPATKIQLALDSVITKGLPSGAKVKIWGVKA